MPNDPKAAREKRMPVHKRNHGQDDHEGSAHTPDEFDDCNPQKIDKDKEKNRDD